MRRISQLSISKGSVKVAFLAVALIIAALAVSCTRSSSGSARAGAWNLLLVTLDTVRADHLGAYGDRDAETPALDRLARDGVRFEHAISAVPLTLPSHATILSGLTPPHHGLHNNGARQFPRDRETLASALSAAGYRTAAFLGSFVLDRRFGLARGFDLYDDEIERDPNDPRGLEAERPGSVVVDRALAWLEKSATPSDHPFFAWVHLYDAHAPYTPPEPFRSRHPRALYDGEIASVDAQVERLLEFLERRSLTGKTVVAVVADHGESLGEHGELTHGLLLYEPSLRVPFLIRAPGLLRAGRVVRTPVGLADVAPTLAGLLGRRFPSGTGSKPTVATALDGRDLSAELHRGSEPPERDLHAETEYPRVFGWGGLSALRHGRLKYIDAPRAELYDLSRDPGEAANLLGARDRRSDLEARLRRGQEHAVAAAPAAGRLDESAAKLASLGYIGGNPAADKANERPSEKRDPKDMVGLFRKFEEANSALGAGRIELAAEMLRPLVFADPRNSVFRGLLAQAHRRQGDFQRAVELYRQAVAAAPEDADARYNLAVTLQEAGHTAEARVAIEETIRRDPSRPEAHNAFGITLSAQGRLSEALAEFDRAVDLDPRDARAENNRGNILRQLGQMEEAEQAYHRTITLAPRYPDPLNGLGTLEVARHRPAAALPYFQRALELAPAYHEVRLNLGIAFETLGDTPAALASYREFIRAASGDPSFASQRHVAQQLIARLTNPKSLSAREERR